MYIEGSAFIERDAGMALITGFSILVGVLAIDGLCQDPGTRGLTNPPGPAKEKGMR